MAEINNTKTCHAGKDVEYEKYSYIVDGIVNLYRHYMVVSQKIGTRATSRSSYTTVGHIPKGQSILRLAQLCS